MGATLTGLLTFFAWTAAASAGGTEGAPTAQTDSDQVIARARLAEVTQLRALSGTKVALHTRGWVSDGKTTRTIESFRRLEYRGDAAVANLFERALLDGKPVGEPELRKAMGAGSHPPERQREILSYALSPFSSPDIEVTAAAPAPGGGYTVRCKVKHPTLVSALTVVVDARTGRKRTARLEIAGFKAKLADRLENVLTYADDGAPVELHANFHAKVAWIERSAEFHTKRVGTAR